MFLYSLVSSLEIEFIFKVGVVFMATRYPAQDKKTGVARKNWSATELKNIPQSWKGDHLNDGGGLRGHVRVNKQGEVTVNFQYSFRFDGKTRWFYCGTFPEVTISDIRKKRDRAKALVSEGVNPTEMRQAERIEKQEAISKTIAEDKKKQAAALTVADLFNSWITANTGVKRQDGNEILRRVFNKHVLPEIGAIHISKLIDDNILGLLKAIKSKATIKDGPQRGLNRTIDVIYRDLGQMLRWGEKRQPWRRLMVEGNPIDLIEPTQVAELQDEGYKEERERILSDDEIWELKAIFKKLEDNYFSIPIGQKYSGSRPVSIPVQCAVWLCLSTLCRIGELLMAKWQHIDLKAGTWHIPAANTKGRKHQRRDHNITLSNFAIGQFKCLKAETGNTDFCFPSRNKPTHVCTKSVSKQIGDRQVSFKNRDKPLSGRLHNDDLVLSAGANGEWTPHDLRRTGSTMMQKLGISPDIIDRCQNHVIETKSKTRKNYQHYDYTKEKAEAWRLWGDYLDVLLK